MGLIADANAKNVPVGGLYVTTAETGALNIRSTGKDGLLMDGIEPIYGNTFVYELDAPQAQNKVFRIYMDISAVTSGTNSNVEFYLSSPTGTLFAISNATLTITTIALALSDTIVRLTADFATWTPVITSTIEGTYTGYIEIEFTEAPGFNYVLTSEVLTNVLEMSVLVVQESVDAGMIGEWKMIGSDDEIGDCIQFWTTRDTLPEELVIYNVSNPASTTIRIETIEPHGLVDGQSVRISGVEGVPEANGEWIISVVSVNSFDLLLAIFVGPNYVTGGVVTTSVYGLGEIGVAVQNNQGVTSYTRLLRSNEFNFSTKKQIDCRVKRKQDAKIGVYFVDNLNQFRVFYYKGAYITDGSISTFFDDGQYTYGTIALDLQLFISNEGFGIRFFDQSQTGGSVKSGNWRYAVRFLTTELVPSEWSLLTDTVSVFTTSTDGFGYAILGDEENIDTPKINILEINNAVPGIYTFCEIAAVNYLDSSKIGYIIGRYTLDGTEFQYINHTGNENNLVDLDLGELNRVLPSIVTGRNVELLDSRLVISNLTPSQVIDFTPWVETFQYSLEREALDPVGPWLNLFPGTLQVAEYQLTDNIYSKKSHMIYETYRYGFRFRLKGSGALTQVFYPGYDIKIDLPASLPTERIPGTFTSFDLTNGAAGVPSEVYTIYINWQNINLSYTINGVPVRDLISEIIVCRAEVIPEVLASGASVLGVSGINNAAGVNNQYYYGTVFASPQIGPFPYISGFANASGVAVIANPTYPVETIGAPYEVAERDTIFFFSPDFSFNQTRITYRTGDQIISFGNPVRYNQATYLTGAFEADYAEYNGYSNITANPAPFQISDSAEAPIQTPTIVVNGQNCSLTYTYVSPPLTPAEYPYYVDQCVICGLSANLTNSGPNNDYGFYRSLYYRPISNKYGNANTTIYTEFGAPYKIENKYGVISAGEIVSYGDVFTQKTYLKWRNPGNYDRIVPAMNDGFGMGIGYYTQNRNNIQLRRKPTPSYSASLIIPTYPQEAWLIFGVNIANAPYVFLRDNQFFYNKGYTPRNGLTNTYGFDSDNVYQRDWSNAIMWSNSDVDGSNTDYMRIFGPLNIKFLDYTFGPVMGAINVNGELITIQHSLTQRQYFNTTEVISSEIGSEVILGDGGVMRRKGQTLTTFGSQNKWSIMKGKSDKGYDVLYFIDVKNRTVCRFGYNGNDAIDEINGMKAFFANNLQWVTEKDTPAHDEGIHGVQNQRYREFIYTMRGRKEVSEWVRDEIVYIPVAGFDANFGVEMVVNPEFNGGLNGWVALDGAYAPANTWVSYFNTITQTYQVSGVFPSGFITQASAVPFVNGTTYFIHINAYFIAGVPVQISFQNGGPVAYSITPGGNYYNNYVAQVGDDNIYIYQNIAGTAFIESVSIREVLSIQQWDGGGTWLITPTGAIADGSDIDDLTQTIPAWIVDNIDYVFEYTVVYGTAGEVTCFFSDVSDVPRNTSDTFTFNATPTAPGVIRFVPSGGFDGTVKGRFRLRSDNPKNYNIGDVVKITPGTNFEQTPDIYVALAPNTNSQPTPTNPDWLQVSHLDANYYNEYSIIFAELKDTFQTFFTPKPKIYAEHGNHYLVPRPVSDTGQVYISDTGTPTVWFFSDAGSQTSDAFFDAIINQPMGRKRFLDVRVEAESGPFRMEVATSTQVSFTPGADFIQRPSGEFDAPVKNDSSVTGFSDGDTSSMFGDWMRYRFIIQATTYNNINSFVGKVRSLARQFFR